MHFDGVVLKISKKVFTLHKQASGTEKIEGFGKNIFIPLLVGHENGKSKPLS